MELKSVLKLENAEKSKVESFIQHWMKNSDLPCSRFEIESVDLNTLLLSIFYPLNVFDGTVTQFISVLFAEISLAKDFGKVTFLDLELPKEIYSLFAGPSFGAEEIKERFNVQNYPLLLGIIKPSLNTPLSNLKNKINEVLEAGFHAVKDDEMLGNFDYSSLDARIELAKNVKGYIPTVNLDSEKEYMEMISGPDSEKISMVLINASTIGFPLLNQIKKVSKTPLCTHMALQGILSQSLSPALVAKLHRLFGCDAYVMPIGGRDYYRLSLEDELKMIHEFTKDLPIKKTLPIIVGGATPANIKSILKEIPRESPFGIAFGSFIFSNDNIAQNCQLIRKEVDNWMLGSI